MTGKSRRLTTWLVIISGSLVLVVAGFAGREMFLEQYWMWKLDSEDANDRRTATEQLGEMRSIRAIPQLVKILRQSIKEERIESLGSAEPFISGRAGGLFQSRPPALRYSAHALMQIGPPAVPGLIELFDIDPKRARLTVDPILMSIGRVTSHELPLLTRLLAHESAHVRKKAIIALQRIHPRAKAAIPSLLGILNDNDEEVRRFARSALDGMGPVSGLEVPVLIETLRDKRRSAIVRKYAAEALVTEVAVPELGEVLERREEDITVRRAAARTLGRLGKLAAAGVPALGKAIGEEDRMLRWAAAVALRDIGQAADGAAPELRRALEDQDRFIRKLASEALRNIEGESLIDDRRR